MSPWLYQDTTKYQECFICGYLINQIELPLISINSSKKWQKGSSNDYQINLESLNTEVVIIKIDGQMLMVSDYQIQSKNIILINQAYLNKLSVGQHLIEVWLVMVRAIAI